VDEVMKETEKRYGVQVSEWFRYLYSEMKRISDERGGLIAVPETFAQYIPKK
jgi:hypothetical protein